jgi:hypothetical protein
MEVTRQWSFLDLMQAHELLDVEEEIEAMARREAEKKHK